MDTDIQASIPRRQSRLVASSYVTNISIRQDRDTSTRPETGIPPAELQEASPLRSISIMQSCIKISSHFHQIRDLGKLCIRSACKSRSRFEQHHYVIDYTSPLKRIIMESESVTGGLSYRYTYGIDRSRVVANYVTSTTGSVTQHAYEDTTGELVFTVTHPEYSMVVNNVVKLFYHQDHLGTTDYLTDNADGKVISYVTYDDWGSLTAKAVLNMGVRELDLVQDYTGHPYDMVLGLYYAKARMYDADDRRFMAVDPVGGGITNPQTLVKYTYCDNNPIIRVDLNGREWTEQDKDVYQKLLDLDSLNGSGAISMPQAEIFKMEIMTATRNYEHSQKNNDLFGMNNARYRAVEARQQYYKIFAMCYQDTYDYSYGKDVLAFLGVHEVKYIIGTGRYHKCIVIFLSSSAMNFFEDRFEVNSAYGGSLQYVTIGAESRIEGNLIAELNRISDSDLEMKVEMQLLSISDVAGINGLFALIDHYNACPIVLKYNFSPENTGGQAFNTNSFTSGLLVAAGIEAQAPSFNVPGWNNPVPKAIFNFEAIKLSTRY